MIDHQQQNQKPRKPKEWCQAVRNVEGAFGDEKAMGYLIGEKLLKILEVAETNREWRDAIPAFMAEIKDIFETWRLAEFLNSWTRHAVLGRWVMQRLRKAIVC